MARLREWITRLRATVRPDRQDADLEEELRFHLEMSADEAQRRSGPTAEADRLAVLRHGRLAHGVEAMRDQRGVSWLEDLVRDARYGARALRRSPLFTAVAGLTLALSIGANTAIFSVADAVLLRPLTVSQPHELVVLRQRGPTGDVFSFTSSAAEQLAQDSEVLSGLASFRPTAATLVSVDGEAELLTTQAVSGTYHAVLGVPAIVGRTIGETDREPVAVISHRFWRQRFASDPGVLGRPLQVDGRVFTIVGVTPPGFVGTQPGRHVDVTTPLGARTSAMPPDARWLYLMGRLAPGVTAQTAASALRVRWHRLGTMGAAAALPQMALELDPGAQGMNELRRTFSMPLAILAAAVGLVLLVACANLAGLYILRARARRHEIVLRRSLGATRGHIMRQLLTEVGLLAAAGGAAGVALAAYGTPLLLTMMSRGRAPIMLDIAMNGRTLGVALGLTVLTTIGFGLLPALSASRADLQPQLNRTGPRAGPSWGSWAQGLVAGQVALLVVLLASAALFTGSLLKLRAVDVGVEAARILVVNAAGRPGDSAERRRALAEELMMRFGAIPGVESVSRAMDTPPADALSMCSGIEVPSRPDAADAASAAPVCGNFVGPRFFATMGIRLLAGRDIEAGDDLGAPHRVVISESVARRYFRGEDPIGRQISVGTSAPPARVTASIIGVVADVRYGSLRAEAPLMTYRPYRQETNAPAATFLLRSAPAMAESLIPAVRAEVRAAVPALPPPAVVSLDDRLAAVLVEERVIATLSLAIGILAATLAAIGIYSIVAASVARREREIGIRVALGARRRQVAGMVVGETLRIVAAGLAVGVPAALAVGWGARDRLHGVLFELSPTDSRVLAMAIAGIVVVASLAAFAPARRAARIDPVVAIKRD